MTGLDFPIALRLEDRPVLLVGAGKIASARLLQLVEVGARVHVVAPEKRPMERVQTPMICASVVLVVSVRVPLPQRARITCKTALACGVRR